MRIPHTISRDLVKEYRPSEAALRLTHETRRVLISEDFHWDNDHVPRLTELCVRVLVGLFQKYPVLDILPCNDKNQLLETLQTDLPLPLVTRAIPDGIYWQRMVQDRWQTSVNHVDDYGFSWKRLYMEKHAQEFFESLKPEGTQIEKIQEICNLVSDYVRKLDIRQLQVSQPDLIVEYPEDYRIQQEPKDHINLGPIVSGLKNLVELHIMFGIREVGTNYRKQWFQFSAADCRNLGKGVAAAKNLRLLRIHNSTLDCDKTIALLSAISPNTSLESLDFSNCIIGDEGATAIAKFLKDRETLRSLKLCNNKVQEAGVSALAFVLTQPECSPLDYLNLRLNSFSDAGAKFLTSALIRGQPKIKTLNLSCCNLSEDSGVLFAEMLSRNTVLMEVDLSNNELGPSAGDAIEREISQNKTLQYLDLRMTGVSKTAHISINRYLHLNRIRARKGEKAVEREIVRLEELAALERQREAMEMEDDEEDGMEEVQQQVVAPTDTRTDED